jgi:hypothetical protein
MEPPFCAATPSPHGPKSSPPQASPSHLATGNAHYNPTGNASMTDYYSLTAAIARTRAAIARDAEESQIDQGIAPESLTPIPRVDALTAPRRYYAGNYGRSTINL